MTVRAVGTYTAAISNLGYCILCNGTDNTFSDQTFTGSGLLNTPLTFGSSSNLIIPAGFSWFNNALFFPFVGQVYSKDNLNVDAIDHSVTFGVYGQPNVILLAFEDWFFSSDPTSDGDYNDFLVEVTYLTAPPDFLTPEPGAMFTLAGGLAALVLFRRRRTSGSGEGRA
jgi:hypothetical protein